MKTLSEAIKIIRKNYDAYILGCEEISGTGNCPDCPIDKIAHINCDADKNELIKELTIIDRKLKLEKLLK